MIVSFTLESWPIRWGGNENYSWHTGSLSRPSPADVGGVSADGVGNEILKEVLYMCSDIWKYTRHGDMEPYKDEMRSPNVMLARLVWFVVVIGLCIALWLVFW